MNFENHKVVSENEHILINVFFNLCGTDYRYLKKTFNINDESLIEDCISNFNKENHIHLSNLYKSCNLEGLNYRECESIYEKLRSEYKDSLFRERFLTFYGIEIKNKELLINVISKLTSKYPNKNWKQDNIFILRKLDTIRKNAIEKTIELRNQAQKNKSPNQPIYLGVKKKLTPDDILNSTNIKLIMEKFNLSKEEATNMANNNYDKRMIDKIFIPYIPD